MLLSRVRTPPGGCFTNILWALQNILWQFVYCEIVLRISSWNYACVPKAMGICTKFQLEILTINEISGNVDFDDIILENSRNISETTPDIVITMLRYIWANTLRINSPPAFIKIVPLSGEFLNSPTSLHSYFLPHISPDCHSAHFVRTSPLSVLCCPHWGIYYLKNVIPHSEWAINLYLCSKVNSSLNQVDRS